MIVWIYNYNYNYIWLLHPSFLGSKIVIERTVYMKIYSPLVKQGILPWLNKLDYESEKKQYGHIYIAGPLQTYTVCIKKTKGTLSQKWFCL